MSKTFYIWFHVAFFGLFIITPVIRFMTDTGGWITIFMPLYGALLLAITYLVACLPTVMLLAGREVPKRAARRIAASAFSMVLLGFLTLISFNDNGDGSYYEPGDFSIFGAAGDTIASISAILSIASWVCLVIFSVIASRKTPKQDFMGTSAP